MSEPPDAPFVDKLDKLCDRIFAALERGPGMRGGVALSDPAPEPETSLNSEAKPPDGAERGGAKSQKRHAKRSQPSRLNDSGSRVPITAATLDDALRAACAEVGIIDRDVPSDGRWHKTDIEGDPRGRGDGRIKLFPDGEGGIVCNWKGGETLPFFVNDGRKLTEAERRDRERRRAKKIRLAQEEEARIHAEAREKAAAILEGATGDPSTHPYALQKRVPFGPLVKRGAWPQREWTDALLVPIYGGDGRLWSVLAINSDGAKDFLAGGRMGGGFHPFRKVRGADSVLVGEGLANVAVCVAAEPLPAVAALSASNLKAVALAVREVAPETNIILLADNDVKPDGGNRGLKMAMEAALAVGGRVAVPELGGRKCDFWDLWHERGAEAVQRAIAGAPAAGKAKAGNSAAPGDCESRVIVTRGDTLSVKPPRWLWDGWLAHRKLHLVAGAIGAGKTTVAIGLAAVVTTGGLWPDSTRCTQGDVLIWSDEDDPEDTLLPRFLAAGGDPRRIHFVTGTVDRDGTRHFDPATDIPALVAAGRNITDLKLVIVDPVVTVVAGDSHKNTEVRRALRPLVGLASDLSSAVLGISHHTKGTAGRDPVERITGSLAFGALPRVTMAAARDGTDPERRIFCRTKSNIGPDMGGWEYRLELTDVAGAEGLRAVRARWGQWLEGSAKDLLAGAEASGDPDPEQRSKLG